MWVEYIKIEVTICCVWWKDPNPVSKWQWLVVVHIRADPSGLVLNVSVCDCDNGSSSYSFNVQNEETYSLKHLLHAHPYTTVMHILDLNV